jgi:hypothetical protein
MLRYVDALQIFKIRHGMRKQIKARVREARRAEDEKELSFMEDLLRENPEADLEQDLMGRDAAVPEEPEAVPAPDRRPVQVVDLHQEFRHRFPWYLRFRSFLLRHRIRTHLVSGIEFQMAVFIVAPALDSVAAVTVGAGVLLLVFELAIIYKLLLSTRDFTRTLASFETTA